MNIKTQILVIAVVIILLIALVDMIRKNKLELKYALLWFLLGVGILIFTCFPWLTDSLARLTGVSIPVNLLFFVGFCFSLVIIFSLTTALSRLSNRVKKLTQELALLKKDLADNNIESDEQGEYEGESISQEIL